MNQPEDRAPQSPAQARSGPSSKVIPGKSPRLFSWLPKGLQTALGKLVLRVCSERPATCAKTRCHLRALCECAESEDESAHRLEARVWTVVIVCAALVLITWAVLGLVPLLQSVPRI